MKKLATRAPEAPEYTPTAEAPTKEPDAQDLVGNAAVNEELEDEYDESLDTEVLDYWFGEPEYWDVELDPAVDIGEDSIEAVEEAEASPISRPAAVSRGMTGALVGDGSDIDVKAEASDAAATSFTVEDGVPAIVVDSSETHVEVELRVGTSKKTGWVPVALFSDQPDLARDEDHPEVQEDYNYELFEGDLTPKEGEGPTTQGGLGDCFFIASLAAIHFAAPEFSDGMVSYDPKTKRYTVRFYEEVGRGRYEPVDIEVDGMLPVSADQDPAYAGDPGDPLWGAIVEKAYAKFKGGYDVLGEGGAGSTTLGELTGQRSQAKNPASMSEEEVVPYFRKAKEDGLAIYAGVINSIVQEAQTPLSGSDEGPYSGTLRQAHHWNEIEPGTVSVTDTGDGKAGYARDTGHHGDKTGGFRGNSVDDGEVEYESSKIDITYRNGRGPEAGGDLEVGFEAHGVVLPSKMLIGNHAYAFSGVTESGELQFYNPWGSYQPKPITAGEFLQYFDSLATNQVPKDKTEA